MKKGCMELWVYCEDHCHNIFNVHCNNRKSCKLKSYHVVFKLILIYKGHKDSYRSFPLCIQILRSIMQLKEETKH